MRSAASAIKLDCHLKFLGGSECHLLASLDFDCLTSSGIATHTGASIPYVQDTQTSNLHPLTFLKMFCDHADQVVEHLMTSTLGKIMLVGECRD
jgi:hypothetical protein